MPWNTTFPGLLAICASASEVYSQRIFNAAGDLIGLVPAVRNDHPHRARAAVLMGRELVRRLESGEVDYSSRGAESGVFEHFAYRAVHEAESCAGGAHLAHTFCTVSPRPLAQQGIPGVWCRRGQPAVAQDLSIDDILHGASVLAADVAARQAASESIDATLAGQCAATLAAARAAFVAELNTRFPGRGFA